MSYKASSVLICTSSFVSKLSRKEVWRLLYAGAIKVLKVYVCDGRQVMFLVQKQDGSTHRVSGFSLIQATWFGYELLNASIGSGGVVSVDADVPRERLERKVQCNGAVSSVKFMG